MEEQIIRAILLLFLGFEALIDCREKQVSPFAALVIFGVGIGARAMFGPYKIYEVAIASLVGLFMLFISFASREALGFGDGLIMISAAPFMGFTGCIWILLFALGLSAIASIVLLVIRRRNRKDSIAFAPFILSGYVLTLVVA